MLDSRVSQVLVIHLPLLTFSFHLLQEDYKQAVKEIDAKLFGNLQLICAELRNNYVRA